MRVENGDWQMAAAASGEEGRALAALAGRRVLIVEDEALVAMDLEMSLIDAGARVVGPALTLAAAQALVREPLDAAILDVDLHGLDVYPAADTLRERGVPFIFHSAHGDREGLTRRFPHTAVVRKPATIGALALALARIA